MKQQSKIKYILQELGAHLPYSIFGITMGITVMGILTFFAILMGREAMMPVASKELFHISHAGHILFSSLTTTAMFWKHEKRLFKAILVGLIGSVSICGVSDILIPFFGGKLIGAEMAVHVCLLQEPDLVLSFAFIGVLVGLLVPAAVEKSTEYSHSVHVLFSSAASILYLLAFGLQGWIDSLSAVFFVTIVAVVLPCCASDIVFPLACTHRNCSHS